MQNLKLSSLTWALFTSCLCFTVNLFGQVDPPPTPPSFVIMDDNEGGNDSLCILLSHNNTTTFYATIMVTNVVPLWQAVEGVPYSLPDSFPNMGFEYEIGTNTGVANFGSYYYTGTNFNGYPLFSSKVAINLNFTSGCKKLESGGNGPDLLVTGTYLLVETDSGLDQPYPISSASGPLGLFSCRVFDETCGYCDPSCAAPITEVLFTRGYCFTCFNGAPHIPDDVRSSSSSLHDSNTATLIFPTPSFQNVKVQYLVEESAIGNILIFDPSGKLIRQTRLNAMKGLNIKEIDLSEFEQGLYFGQLHLNDKVENFKIIKSK